jgi:hypothetical protein
MNTKFVGVKEFRQNMASYAKKAQKKDTRYVVVNRDKPLFIIEPFDEDTTLESFYNEIQKARADVAAGRVFTQAEVIAGLEARLK